MFLREWRGALRERTIVVNSILIPIFLYPFLLWLAFTGMMFVMGQAEGARVRVPAPNWPAAHPKLRLKLEHDPGIDWVARAGAATDLEAQVKAGKIDAAIEFLPPTNSAAGLAGNFQARILYDQSREASVAARDRLADPIERYREEWTRREARARGLDAGGWQVFTLTSRNLASQKQIGAFLLGMVTPAIFVIMVAIGCFYPAVDALAGERERNTWETLMSTAATRLSIVTAKYLYVVSLGGLAGLLNMTAILLTLKPVFAPLLARAGRSLEFALSPGAVPVVLVAALLLAGFIGAGMMIFAAFARTFKEGQAMVMPFYLVILLPIVFLQAPGIHFSAPLACVPVVNVTLMLREAVSGSFHALPIAITVGVSLVLIALCLRVAAFILKFEDVVLGSYQGSLGPFLKERFWKRQAPRESRPPDNLIT